MNEQDPRAADRATMLEAHAVTTRAIGRALCSMGAISSGPYAPLLRTIGRCVVDAADEIEAEAAKAAG